MRDVRPYLEIRSAGASGFSPDASRVLVSSNLSGTAQLYRVPVDGGDLVALTAFNEPVGGAYLPTEPTVLVAADVGGNERYQLYLLADEPGDPARAPEDLHPLVVDPDHIHRAGGVTRDGRLLAFASNTRNGVDFDVHLLELPDGAPRRLFAPGGWCGAAGFRPDGTQLAVHRLTDRSGDNEIHLVDVGTGDSTELAPHPDEEAAVGAPSWLPDGSSLLFSTNIDREFSAIAQGAGDGAWAYVLETSWDSGAAYDWTGQRLLVVANVDGYTRAWLHDPETLEQDQQLALPGDGVAGGFRFSRDGRYLSYSFSSALIPGDAWVEDLQTGTLRRLTVSPCEVDPATFVASTLERFPSHDGVEVPVYVYRPRRASGRTPVVAYLHGGPESQFRPSFSPLVQYLVARGYAVVAPNIRGSTGYGRTYEHLDDGRKRLDAVADLAAMHTWIAASDDLDPERVALYGGSYGGYLVLAGLTMQPDLWAAGIDVVGISSLVTFLENTADWRRRFREREYGSLEDDRDFLLEASPMSHIDAIRAPLFIIHGANDPRVPLGEAEQIHAIVREKGLPTDLLVYEDEGHGLAKLRNRLDAYPRVAAFLDDVLGVG